MEYLKESCPHFEAARANPTALAFPIVYLHRLCAYHIGKLKDVDAHGKANLLQIATTYYREQGSFDIYPWPKNPKRPGDASG